MTRRLQISCFLDESRPLVKFLAAWWFLNLVMNLTVPGLQPFSAALLLPSCEIFILMAVTALAVRWGMPFHAAIISRPSPSSCFYASLFSPIFWYHFI